MNMLNSTGMNKKFVPTNIKEQSNVSVSEYELNKDNRLDNANKLITFGGKRFLGLTPKGKPVYVKYLIDKKDKSIKVSFTHELSILLKEDAKLANDRYSFPINAKVAPSNYARMTNKLRKSKSQEVTKQTLHWMKRLEAIVDVKYHKAFKKDIPTTGLIQHIAHVIFTGTYAEYTTPTWHDITKAWKFPKGEYFNPEETWSYPDVL